MQQRRGVHTWHARESLFSTISPLENHQLFSAHKAGARWWLINNTSGRRRRTHRAARTLDGNTVLQYRARALSLICWYVYFS